MRIRSGKERGAGRYAFLVAAGILLSRIAGLIRQRVFAHYFGQISDAADAFNAAFRIPNLLQNLFGEGVLSASFIPVYAGLLARGDDEESGRVAGAVASILALVISLLVLAGVLAAPLLIHVLAPGFSGEKRELAIRLVRILFPGAGLLVFSAWCLGILNSHRRFFISYAAPVIWNFAMIGTLLGWGGRVGQFPLAVALAWGSVAGSALQVCVQLPWVLRLARGLRPSLRLASEHVRTVLRSFVPVFFSRGVVQISAYVDTMIASLLPTGALAALANAQLLYTLPVSLFGMSVSAAELPVMSGAVAKEAEAAAYLRRRLDAGLRQIAFFIVPTAIAFLALGDVIAAAIFQTGRFTRADAVYVWGILAGSTIGLLASTLGRLYSSSYYAMIDPHTPLRYAAIRVALTGALGYCFAVPLPPVLGIEPRWGVAGLMASGGIAAWVEFTLLRRTMNRRIGVTGLAPGYTVRLFAASLCAAAAGWAVKLAMGTPHPIVAAVAILPAYGIVYIAMALALRIDEVRSLVNRLR
ncbi:MAG TPA: murein biosynthesis integral membrane protein MurJ [Bryobacteraceae bacterium]|nr:murein biosynthesis integral membrane protein MurJ [Bryobacteraceae bacterium]HOQ45155.1 murein biosynthesis integral membrane protein MurJ [Bryobacteraceae bacterium]HPU71227.1 murein biosynthesis integral membrane protein MurJ [Bryobacteraceae bacterium]